MDGITKTTFEPESHASRAMFLTVLYRLAGKPAVSLEESPFRDVAKDAWFGPAVLWAYETGVTQGYGDQFGPDDSITREQVATFLFRYAGKTGRDVSKRDDLSAFSDAKDISPWAKDAMSWAVAEVVFQGVAPAMVLSPQDPADRAQLAAILTRFGGYTVSSKAIPLVSF